VFDEHDVAIPTVNLCKEDPAAVLRNRQSIAEFFLGIEDGTDCASGKIEVVDRLSPENS